jgi:hypothetical protein
MIVAKNFFIKIPWQVLFSFDGIEVWTQGLALARQGRYSTTWATCPALFALVIFGIGSHIFPVVGLDHSSPIYLSVTEVIGIYHHTQLGIKLGVFLTFCPGCTQTVIFLISAFQVAEITGMSHCTW